MSNAEHIPDERRFEKSAADPPPHILCPRCFHVLGVLGSIAGKKYKCPKCFHVMRMPDTFSQN